jgi:hypothetical protein
MGLMKMQASNMLLSADERLKGYSAGAELLGASQLEHKEAEARRGRALLEVERLMPGGSGTSELAAARARLAEAEAACELSKAQLACAHVLMEAHEDDRLTAEERRHLKRLKGFVQQREQAWQKACAAAEALGGAAPGAP